jgi:glycosyltransferase involved in cell wall biosynthesis
MTTLRHRLGVWLYDRGPFLRALQRPDNSWLALCNRRESVRLTPDGRGVLCEWDGSSELHATHVMPSLGSALLRRALLEHPVRSADAPRRGGHDGLVVTFVIGHRGMERLPLLRAVLGSIAAQDAVMVECLVVEEILPGGPSILPDWVRHIRVPLSSAEEPYRRGRNFNVGAQAARGQILVFHDGDILMPCDYSAEVVARVGSGSEIVDLKRYLFYLSSHHTDRVLRGRAELTAAAPEMVVQNAPGGTIAVSRSAFERIGGFDEQFEGWGGEDVEFLERAATCRLDRFASLPFVHLWHAAQPGKTPQKETPGMALYRRLTRIPPDERIQALRARQWSR